MSKAELIRIDEILWWLISDGKRRLPVAICPEHKLRLTPVKSRVVDESTGRYRLQYEEEVSTLQCAEGPHVLRLPRRLKVERQYVLDRVDAKAFARMKVLNLDDEAVPIAEDKARSTDERYFATVRLMESKRGLQLVVYAGERGKSKKTQIFLEPEVKRLAFDQKDLHPTDVFVELKATFDDGSCQLMLKGQSK